MTEDLDTLTIEAFGRKLRSGEVTSRGVTEACLQRIEADNPILNAFILVMGDEARQQAAAADRELAEGFDRGPLHGVPISIKDLIDVRGTATTAASRVRAGHRAACDATVVERLRRAGAVFVGKTNLHEFAFGTTNEESAFGPARNPRDRTRSPGGSSGGSAASIVAGMALASIGTDTGGSIRIPAAACGCVGLKPAYGEVPTEGVVPLSRALDHVGPLARSVNDAWLVHCGMMAFSSESDGTGPLELPAMSAGEIRLAVLHRYFCDRLDDEVRAHFEESLERLRGAGARVDEVEIPHADQIAPIYLAIVLSDAAALHSATLDAIPERYTAPVRTRLEMGRYVLAEDYSRALRGREALRLEVDDALRHRDALVLPTLPIPAPELGTTTVKLGSTFDTVRNVTLRLTQLFNLTGHPAISLPLSGTSDGLPTGLQLVGSHGRTDQLVRVARTCEALSPRPYIGKG